MKRIDIANDFHWDAFGFSTPRSRFFAGTLDAWKKAVSRLFKLCLIEDDGIAVSRNQGSVFNVMVQRDVYGIQDFSRCSAATRVANPIAPLLRSRQTRYWSIVVWSAPGRTVLIPLYPPGSSCRYGTSERVKWLTLSGLFDLMEWSRKSGRDKPGGKLIIMMELIRLKRVARRCCGDAEPANRQQLIARSVELTKNETFILAKRKFHLEPKTRFVSRRAWSWLVNDERR